MKKALLFVIAIVWLVYSGFTQTINSTFGIKFSGFVRSDIFMDTHENVVLREGVYNIYPEAPSYDYAGKDINEKLSFSFVSVVTRITGNITGPDAFGAKTTGLIEGEFFGTSDADINGFRMRHAYVNLKWTNTELRIGQAWHPMFIPECFPQTISFNTGAPFNVFNRSPQIRLTKKFGRTELLAAIVTERDFQSRGPDPADPAKTITSTQFIRNSGLPEFQLVGKLKLDSLGNFKTGGGIGTKSLKPDLYYPGAAGTKTKSTQTIRSYSGFAFVSMVFNPLEIRLTGIYCQNAYDLTMLGGYAVKDIVNTTTGEKTYTPITTLSLWGDFQYTGSNWKSGIFIGYTSNLGAVDKMTANIFYSRGSNIAYVYRAAPRFTFTSGKLDLNVELEYTVAAYGTVNSEGTVDNSKEVKNIRPLLTTVYNF